MTCSSNIKVINVVFDSVFKVNVRIAVKNGLIINANTRDYFIFKNLPIAIGNSSRKFQLNITIIQAVTSSKCTKQEQNSA